MSASVSNYLFAMEERQRALPILNNNNRAEPGVGVPVNSPAKRCLFGAPDPVELKRKYDELHEEERNRGAQKWGFDFETETPLENSRYEWERVESGVPIAYDLPQLGPSERSPETDATTKKDSCEEQCTASSSQQQPSSSSELTSSKQMHITDFMQQKRRRQPSSNKRQQQEVTSEKRQRAVSTTTTSHE